ncbi:sodium:proton antiporter [Mycolicibacterium moriokaense]|nr:sodium:proton antiporter [Mycolicibacterium moriokaense]
MAVVDAEHRWDANRDESEAERLDRNWSSLLQELRVTQTGVQLLTGFLLTLPFQARFTQLDTTMRIVYLLTVACSLGATVLLIAPVGMHRVLFRRHRLDAIVSAAHACAIAGLILLGAALSGVGVVIFDTVIGRTWAWVVGGATLTAFTTFWFLIPLPLRRTKNDTSY